MSASVMQYQSKKRAVLTKFFSSLKVIKLTPNSRKKFLNVYLFKSASSNWPKSRKKTSKAIPICFSSNPSVNICSMKK